MTVTHIRVLVPPRVQVEAPRGALWAADAAVWLWRTLRGAAYRKEAAWSS